MSATTAAAPPMLPASSRVIAGFWRRLFALFIDLLLLGALGLIIGALFFDPLARMGDAAKVIGFVIALAYFGVCNSRVLGGQTLAKRWLGLRVVDARGGTLSLPRSMLRYVVLGVPFFANGTTFNPQLMLSSWLGNLLALIVFGGMLSIIYLYVFNRRTRQSLHDLAQVVRARMYRNGAVTHAMQAALRLDAPMTDDGTLAKRIARMLAKGDPDIASEDAVQVTLIYGYNMGIASGWKKRGYSFKPDGLR